MQALCIVTAEDTCDVSCPTCGQKYSVYYSRQGKAECEEALELIRCALLEHHARNPLPTAHPGDAFNIPAWNGPAHASAAALLSGAHVRCPSRNRPASLTLVPSLQQRRVS